MVGLPVFFVSVLGWDFWQAGGFIAAWTVGYGFVQAATPSLIRRRVEGAREPDGRTATGLAFGLAAFPAAIAPVVASPPLMRGPYLFGWGRGHNRDHPGM